MEEYHEPVLLNEVLGFLEISREDWIVDATLGDGGYDVEILKRDGRIIGLDVDPQAIERVQLRFKDLGISEGRFRLIQGNFRDIENLIKQTDIEDIKINAIIFDLGVSSLQLDSPERGFSFSKSGPLDMRMDPNLPVTAADLVNTLTKEALSEIFQKLGEDRFSSRFAEVISRTRRDKKITTTGELAQILEQTAGGRHGKIPLGRWAQGKHPATRVFQALRIAVNDELHAIDEALPQALNLLKRDGKLLVISFHSLEDRIVKNTFRSWQDQNLGIVLTKRPVVPTEEEIERNPRSRSAKLRVFRKKSKTHDNYS
jgi:16S rRNA (cytosine1402-N4)-methyltransferase